MDHHYDISPQAAHSVDWELQDEKTKKLCVPNYDSLPPRKDECEMVKASAKRVMRFYVDGEDKQMYYFKELQIEKDFFQKQLERIEEQRKGLQSFPEHPTKRYLQEDLDSQLKRVQTHLRAREEAKQKLDLLFTKRAEFVQTMNFLTKLVENHCSKST